MQRKIFQSFLFAAVRPRVNFYAAPRSCFHLMNNILFCKSSSLPTATEEKIDFSDISSEKFGTLRPERKSTREKMEVLSEEEDERIEYDITNVEGRKNRRPKEYYEKLIEKLLVEKKLVEALDVLETRILKKDRIHPWYRVYNLLINGCAQVGYCDKAFALYQDMKAREIKPTPATYTGLFNAIANSPFPKDAERKLIKLRKTLAENGVELSKITYHAMIKAYARLKDTYSAFLVADEMLSKGHALTDETCNFLLQACISDTEAGLRHALLLWHKRRSRKITPTGYSYNLLFRCIRDCGFGTQKDLKDIIEQINCGRNEEMKLTGCGEQSFWSKRISWKKKSKKPKELFTSDAQQKINSEQTQTEVADVLQIGNIEREKFDDSQQSTVEIIDVSSKMESEQAEPEIIENKPNLLAAKPHLGNIVAISEVKTASDRLLLLGGINTLLEQMKSDEVKPNIKTFTLLLDIIPATDAAEDLLLKEIKNNDMHIDIDFCNMLIKKRAMRWDYEKAREVLNIIQANYLEPNIVTFGVLAVSCNKLHEAEELVYQLRDFGYRLNMPILGAMLARACSNFDFDYILFIMKTTRRIGINVSEEYMNILDNFNQKVINILRRKKQGDKTLKQFFYKPHFFEDYRMWREYHERFKKEIHLEIPQHPYKQFQKVTTDDAEVEEIIEKDKSEVDREKHFYNNKHYRQGFKPKSKFIYQKDKERKNDVEIGELKFSSSGKNKELDVFERQQKNRRERKPETIRWKRNSQQ